MFSRRIISFFAILIMVSQSFVLVNTDSPPNFVENSSILEELAKNSGARTESYTLYKGVEMTPITFDYDGYGTPSWEIYPNLPSDLSFNSANGTITGTPD